jgi:hypothetical protein
MIRCLTLSLPSARLISLVVARAPRRPARPDRP